MSVHPSTPITEGDLTCHLGQQGKVSIEKFPYLWFDEGRIATLGKLGALAGSGAGAILLDAASAGQLTDIGFLLDEEARRRAPVFVVGGSGVEYALTQFWRETGALPEETRSYDSFRPVDRLLAISGSASKVTAAQIDAAVEAGFADIPIVARDLLDDALSHQVIVALAARAAALLQQGRSVMLHTARGPDDPRIGEMLDSLVARGLSREDARHSGGRDLGVRLGDLVRRIIAIVPLPRIAFAGGDTSSQITQALAPDALEVAARLSPGVPLCRTRSRTQERDGIEIALKGGQVGGVAFFEHLRAGHSQP